jgi:hypothetical protein
MSEVVLSDFMLKRQAETRIARQRIRRGMTNEDFNQLTQSEQEDICIEHHSELRDLEWRGTCSGNCTVDCYTTDQKGEVICRWTWAPCPNSELNEIFKLFSIVNQESQVLCQQ